MSDIGMAKIYTIIETLLPKSVNRKNGKLRLMEIFGVEGKKPRDGWVVLTEKH